MLCLYWLYYLFSYLSFIGYFAGSFQQIQHPFSANKITAKLNFLAYFGLYLKHDIQKIYLKYDGEQKFNYSLNCSQIQTQL